MLVYKNNKFNNENNKITMNVLLSNHYEDLCSLLKEMDEAGLGKENEFNY